MNEIARIEDGPDGGDVTDLSERMGAVIGRLMSEVERRIGRKRPIEQRWIRNIRQYHGLYPATLMQELVSAKKSTAFVNQTRPKTDALSARLSDLLFPTDDRNWAIEPTPVPELVRSAKRAVEKAAIAIAQAKAAAEQAQAANPEASPEEIAALPDVKALTANADELVSAAETLRLSREEAKKRAALMQDELEDQQVECNYAAECREVIEDGCKLGTGILKGPITSVPRRGRWMPSDDGYFMDGADTPRPITRRTNPWDFYPDPDAAKIEDSESEFERHLMTPARLRRLAREPGFIKAEIRALLKQKPRGVVPQYLSELREITGENVSMVGDFYEVWEFHGMLDAMDVVDIARAIGKNDLADMLTEDEVDPLDEIAVTIWFCDGRLLKIGPHPLDSGEKLYSVFNLHRDESSIWGYGVPHILENSQAALNGAWRMAMDNGGITSGPQIVINTDLIDPADNNWTLTPRKIWKRKSGTLQGVPAFEVYNFDSHLQEIQLLIDKVMEFIDDETSLPEIAQGEQGAQTTQTLGGMSILMNSANVVFRRFVKFWDDDITIPTIRRQYDWNMQHNESEDIKGDFEIKARGAAVLLVREMQSATAMAWLTQLVPLPGVGERLKAEGLLNIGARSSMMPIDEVMYSEEELEAEAAKQANAPPDPQTQALIMEQENIAREQEIRIKEIDAKVSVAEMEASTRREVADIQREIALNQVAAKGNIDMDKLEMTLADREKDRQQKDRTFAAELAVSRANGPSGGGNF